MSRNENDGGGLPLRYELQDTRLDGEVATSLLKLTAAGSLRDVDWSDPPEQIQDWLRGASSEEALGILIHSLRRWHQLRR